MPPRTHSVVRDGERLVWEVPRLWAQAADLPAFDRPLSRFADLWDLDVWYGDRLRPTVGSVLDHLARIKAADLSFPIILSDADVVMDGIHRLCKARLRGHETIRAVRFPVTPPPHRREPWPARPDAAEVPRIETARLVLGLLDEADTDAFFAIRSHPDVARFQGFRPAARAEAAAFIARLPRGPLGAVEGWTQLAIRRDGALVGDLGLCFRGHERLEVEVGISLDPVHQGRGLATEALRGVLDHLFGELGRHRVVASVDPRNAPSVALLERVGLRREAHHQQSVRADGAWVDEVVFAVLRAEWRHAG